VVAVVPGSAAEMCNTVAEVRAHVLALLLGGYSPEEVELALEGDQCILEGRTPLTDPTNVLLKEVAGDGSPQGSR
jgi:hypothetical protein